MYINFFKKDKLILQEKIDKIFNTFNMKIYSFKNIFQKNIKYNIENDLKKC